MSKNNNIIEINGQRYNSVTGALVGAAGRGQAQNVDGVVRMVTASPSPALSVRVARPPLQSVVTKPVMDIARPSPAHLAHHSPQSAQTLMRRSVHKPATTQTHFKAQTPTDRVVHQPKLTVQTKLSHQVVDPKRQKRARHASKNGLVHHFGAVASLSTNSTPAPISAKIVTGIASGDRITPAAAASTQPSLDMFQKALAEATSHQQPFFTPPKKSRSGQLATSRSVKMVTSALSIFLLAGFITYQHIPDLKLRLASSRVGFAASMPSYRPAGFAVGGLSYSVGNVAINYHSNSDTRAYTLTEKASNWNSQTLRDVYVVTNAGQAYQTVAASGRTIYLFKNNATWVNSGIWYEIQNNGNLSSKQLLDLVLSL
ncbi:MAG: hypothetical protein ABI602_02150 [Candidatus Saccharibacteria bacterium]